MSLYQGLKYSDVMGLHNPSQSHWELNQLLTLLEQVSPKIVIEIGVHRGGSARVWRDVFHPKKLIGINWGDELDEDRQGISFVDGRSQDQRTFSRVQGLLNGQKADFLFIDGGHLYDEVKTDFELYSPLVKRGGIIAFHDVFLEGNETVEVKYFWDETRPHHKTIEIWDGTPTGTGTGVVFV